MPTLDTLKGLVDFCVRVKLNVLMLYIEHTFHFRRHPQIGAGASPLDAATLRELDTYAAARHVQLVPSLQSLGHMERVLSLPAYAHLAETDRGWTLSPALPETYEFLGDLYDEFLPNFRSRLFNANCDETFGLGLGRAAAMREQLGELLYAADASLCAVRKALAGGRYLAWRRRPASLVARERRALARTLRETAGEQQRLGRRLWRLWIERSQPSDFALTRRRIARSLRSLRRAARALERNTPAPPPPKHPGFEDAGTVMRAVYRSFAEA